MRRRLPARRNSSTVVLPLLAFIRPARAVRSALKWEGVLVDPVGALLGVAVFHLVSSGWEPGEFLLSSVVGAAVGLYGGAEPPERERGGKDMPPAEVGDV